MPPNLQIEEIVRPIIEQADAFLVDVSIKKSNTGLMLEIYIDNDSGITTECCAEISRLISKVIDADNLFEKRYHLVVSSPGIDRPLKLQRQYCKNVGRTMTVRYLHEDKNRSCRGVLIESDAETIVLRLDDDSLTSITYDRIIEARVQPPW